MMVNEILNMCETINENSSKAYELIANKMYKKLPKQDDEIIELCNKLMESRNPVLYQIVTIWIKKKKTLYDIKYYGLYERWLYEYITSWEVCDQFCYRVLNPMLEKYPETYCHNILWAQSDKEYVRRAAAVSLLHSSQSFSVNVTHDKVIQICDVLIQDSHPHVQKGIGWLLKYAYLKYPEETIQYLIKNKENMSRVTYRYSLEKMPDKIRIRMLKGD